MEAFDFAVGLGPVGAGFLDLRAGAFAGFVPGAAAVAAAVVGDDPLAGDAEFAEPGVGARPELCGCFAAFIVEVLAVGQVGAVVEGGVQVAVAGFGARRGRLAAPVDPPAAAGRDGGQLLDVHMDEFTRAFALITHRRRFGGAVAAIQAPQARLVENLLHRRGGDADLVRDPGGAAAPTATQADHLSAHLRRTAPRRPVRATRAIHQTARAFSNEAVAPLAHRLGIHLEPLRGRRDTPALHDHHIDHRPTLARRQPRVHMLPNLCHEPSLRAVSRYLPTASPGGLTSTGNPQSPPPRDNVPGYHS